MVMVEEEAVVTDLAIVEEVCGGSGVMDLVVVEEVGGGSGVEKVVVTDLAVVR